MDKNRISVLTYNNIADIYTEKYFNDKTDDRYIDKFLSYLSRGSRILDAGCGPGRFTRYIKEKGFAVEGIDLSSEMIRIAREKNPGDKFQVMDLRKLRHRNASFDGLIAAYSIIHIPSLEIDAILKGFWRV